MKKTLVLLLAALSLSSQAFSAWNVECAGQGAKLSFSETSPIGQPTFFFEDPNYRLESNNSSVFTENDGQTGAVAFTVHHKPNKSADLTLSFIQPFLGKESFSAEPILFQISVEKTYSYMRRGKESEKLEMNCVASSVLF